jgi:signal transduction histidine kinase
MHLAPDVQQVTSDRRGVEQILINLLNNAVKFTERGGVTLTVDQVADFRSAPSAEMQAALRFAVADTGIGIKPEDLAKLFNPFQQVDSESRRDGEGTGLGLAICQRLAAALGGEVTAVSEYTKQSVFTFTLPLAGLSVPGPLATH